ncbi:NAD(P)(+) transhydrogenase (Re/Si-specific) subunit beta [Aliifodinibius sp. S!AR15-10]|uniref:NAD(P)(+) transhydrogenase (Re/Si-specific) subunit beta n=1 Tax=Aliifodinibius sp. S!AR15-10 TaxID=2950437 RepID=UPI002854BC5A|nr:NAD(P)(+) transhydrogenase (Re/Si-specific) subunit beta [Aliifodinibius sp. S!AR15-10]MDR8392823.1 NAD(P)(+) transhydrogenase (Re/Si-specific) subunit beta [Aliifodinibius sp. S!AR15-10]
MSEFLPQGIQNILPDLIQLLYLVAMSFFIIGIKRLGSPATARSGNQMASFGMLLGVIITLFDQQILTFEYIIGGVLLGGLIGAIAAKKVEMTAMPEMVAIFNGFGGGASALVAWGEFSRMDPTLFAGQDLVTIGLSILIGSITFTGSFIAFGKLKGFIGGGQIAFPGQNYFNLLLTFGTLGLVGWFTFDPTNMLAFWLIFGIALLLGVLTVLPIGGADMPVVISLLNSYSGIAASMAGFVINNNLLIISGALVGAAGLILTNIMCKAMNRTLGNVLFGAFGGDGGSGGGGAAVDHDKTVHETTPDDVALQTAYADKVIIVPGYGLAVAQAQHVLKEVADALEEKGVEVKYGIHPVAGRMPGHMNVLLAEADVPYDQLYDMDQINPEFKTTDVVLIIGANDVVNPAAKTESGSPIYGMPIMNVDEAKRTIVFKRSLSPGYAGIDNSLFYEDTNQMFFGDAKKSLQALSHSLDAV